jgi:sarcosine oxidase
MAENFDVIVIGVGAMGAAACWGLARRSVHVLGLEQFDIPHARGSSHGYSRMTRMSYFEHPNYVPLLRRAGVLWSELEQESGEKILHLVGGLYLGPIDGPLVGGALRSAREHGLVHEVFDRATLARRFPQFTVPGDWTGMLESSAGFLLPELAISAMVSGALRAGAEIHGHEEVRHWEVNGSHVVVETSRHTYRAKKLIFSGGAWSSGLVKDLGVDLVVTRQVMGWVWPKDWRAFQLGTLPAWMIDRGDGTVYYGFPIITMSPGFKIALHGPMAATDPHAIERNVLPGDEETFRECLQRFIPQGDGPTLAIRTCLYTNSPDGHFIIDRHPVHERIVIATGFSGHGFKFATVVGELLADLAMDGRTRLPTDFLRLSRFAHP